jgi:hypothetical protein
MEEYDEILLRYGSRVAGAYVIVHQQGIYIGGTTDHYKRKVQNLSELRRGVHHCKPLQVAYRQDPNVEFRIYISPADKAFDLENDLLTWHRERGYNVFNQGGPEASNPVKGISRSLETRLKMSIAKKTLRSTRSVSEETREKLRKASTGNSNWKGRSSTVKRSISQETKDKISATTRGKSRKDLPIEIDGIRYSGILEAALITGLSYNVIRSRIMSPSKTFKNWVWAPSG